ncbi:MAG: TetR/AcrR family transcriptional regulator [Silvibacterium sp.]|nr:TetR/AcrR family transcriptional regulator [Silvibacterium sp.]
MRVSVQPMRNAKLAAPERRRQIVSIAMEQISSRGFEGLRFQQVARQAGINNATLYYHFPTKEALIQGVVAHLTEELRKRRRRADDSPLTAREELRFEFDDIRALLRAQPQLFIVLIELSLRGLRDPAIGKMEKRRDGFWCEHLSSIIRRGMEQGIFRRDLALEPAVTALMAQFKGIGYHAVLGRRKRREVDGTIAEIARQVEHWLVCGTA